MPADSYLMDGVHASGHPVIHSPLLFQGGNLLAALDLANGRRVLLIGEAEVHRNTALGLTREQVLEAFRVEFGVDTCAVLPVLTHHLDFDVSVRVHNGRLTAFVNDPMAAARLVAQRGIGPLEKQGSLNLAEADVARECLKSGDHARLYRTLAGAAKKAQNGKDQWPVAFARLFTSVPSDSAAHNLQCFLVALDILACKAATKLDPPNNAAARAYYKALRDMDAAAHAQVEVLQKLGWNVVPIPSMPDMFCSLNYLNGLHDRARYLMPAFGGFYDLVDQAAIQAFRQTLGSEVKIIPIFCAEIQRYHGAVHCAASAYPTRWPAGTL